MGFALVIVGLSGVMLTIFPDFVLFQGAPENSGIALILFIILLRLCRMGEGD